MNFLSMYFLYYWLKLILEFFLNFQELQKTESSFSYCIIININKEMVYMNHVYSAFW